jgi:hypothetical protein
MPAVMANRRIFYATQAVGLAPLGTNTFTTVHGLQSVGINTKFNLEQIFEIGQLGLYQNLENLPDIEANLEKCLDGYPLLYHLATYGAPDGTLIGRSNQRTTLGLSLYSDNQLAASGNALQQCTCSGMYLSSLTFDIKIEGSAMETISLVGNNKTWATTANTGTITFQGGFTNADVPLAPEGVNRRQNLVMASGLFPKDIPGIDSGGRNPLQADGFYTVKFQSVRITANLGREMLLELGRKGPYFRYVNFPVEVRCDFEVLATQGDNVNALEVGPYANGENLQNQRIYVQMSEGTKIDLGSKCRMTSVNYGGANAGARGGNAHDTYSFVTFNDLLISHPQDPTPGLAA